MLLESQPLLLTEAGIQPPDVDELSLWFYLDVVRQEPQLENLKKSPAKNVSEQIQRARLALWLGDYKQSKARLGASFEQARTTLDWLSIAQFVFCDLQDKDALRDLLKNADEAIKNIEDTYMLAAFYRWRLDDISRAKRICKRVKRNILNLTELFQWYETGICLFNYDIGQSIEEVFQHKITKNSTLSEICSAVEIALDHLDMHPTWITVIRKLEKKIVILSDL